MFSNTQQQMIDLARQAGEAIMAIYAQDQVHCEIKEDGSPITRADMAAHRLIVSGLANLGLPVLSEESADIPFATRQTWQEYFLVDPLDGTKEFINRTDEFTVNIAHILRGHVFFGVVYAPALQLMYAGGVNLGAWKQIGEQEFLPIRAAEKANDAPLRVVGSRRHGADKLAALLQDIPHTMDNRGSALKICQVADGSADFYPRLGPTSEWDTAAGQAIVEAAGGHLCHTNFAPFVYNSKDSLLNPEFFVLGARSERWRDKLRLD